MSSTRQPFSILNGATASNEISVEDRSFFLLETSAALTGTSFAIHQKRANGTFDAVLDDLGVAVSITVGANQLIALTSDTVAKTMAAASAIKFVGTAQGADRALFLTME